MTTMKAAVVHKTRHPTVAGIMTDEQNTSERCTPVHVQVIDMPLLKDTNSPPTTASRATYATAADNRDFEALL